MTQAVDLLIVGCGVAGLSAAVAGLENGLSVINLERATEEDFGGNSRWTEAYLRMKNESEVTDDFEEHFANNAGWNLDPNALEALMGDASHMPAWVRSHTLPDPEVISTFAESVPSTIEWLKGFGLKFGPQPIYLLTQNTTRIAAYGGGLEIIETLRDKALALGGEIRYRTTAAELLREDDGTVCGTVCVGEDGKRYSLHAKNVIFASGGYQGSQEMMTKYVGPHAKHIRPVARGGYYNRGEGISMMLDAGAAPAGEFGSYHAEPIDPRSRQPEAVIHTYPYGILVNNQGKRFTNEAPGTVDAHYDPISRSIAYQPDGISYLILDQRIEDVPRWKTSVRSEVAAITAGSIEELAKKLDIRLDNLTQTIADFNAACPSEEGEFTPFDIDNRTTSGLDIEKTHWSRPIDKTPFIAYPIIASNCFTFGGVKVSPDAEVIDTDGKTIHGLYAAGETMGLYHQTYAGSTSVLRGLVFGRLAALHAASELSAQQEK